MTENRTGSAVPKAAQQDLRRTQDAVKKEAHAAKEQLSKAGERLREEASNIAGKAKDVVSQRADEGKQTVAAGMNDFAAAVRKASDELGERDQSMAAKLVREVASGLEDASRTIQGRSIQDLTRSVSAFARQQPAAFLLGATVAGIALGRFIKASEDRPEEPNNGGASDGPAGRPRAANSLGQAAAQSTRSISGSTVQSNNAMSGGSNRSGSATTRGGFGE